MDNESKNDNDKVLTLKNCRDVAVLIFFGVMSFKFFSIELSLNIKEFGFTDLLAILIAFFAIGLSAAFYFKATDTSNRFYDNSYAFTKDVSEILGRMEAGFGERLRHLDEGYTGIRDKFDKLPFDSAKAMEDIEKENQEIKNKEGEQRKALEGLAIKAHLAENEKLDLFAHMEKISRELEESKTEARRLEKSLLQNEKINIDDGMDILHYLSRKILKARPSGISMKSPNTSYGYMFRQIRKEVPRRVIRALENCGFIDEDGDLTSEAIKILTQIELKTA
jgi:hypothetical protein